MIAEFIQKAYHMVSHCDPRVISWNGKGDVLVVKDLQKLESTFLPQYFRHKNFSSFARRLYLYGFRRIHPPNEPFDSLRHIKFFHEFFKKGRADLLFKVTLVSNSTNAETSNDLSMIKGRLSSLSAKISKLSASMEVRMRQLNVLTQSIPQKRCCVSNKNQVKLQRVLKKRVLEVEENYALISSNFNTKIDDLQRLIDSPHDNPLIDSKAERPFKRCKTHSLNEDL